jgi:flagellar biosynthesis protein
MDKKTASAVGFQAEDTAPRLLASGRGGTAWKIIALAQEAGVAVVEDPALSVLLDVEVNVGDIIPFWCWEATAKILAFVYSQEGKV